MAQATNVQPRQDFWRPDVEQGRGRETVRSMTVQSQTCERCDTDFAPRARYCHVCGLGREEAMQNAFASRWNPARFVDTDRMKAALGLPLPSLIAFAITMVCTLAALLTGFLYSADTLVDWQAVQIWRVEWMLAALIALAAGILLKKSPA